MENNILFVDDETHILKAIKRGLHKETYNKFYAESGEEALIIMEKEDIHVIVTDMKMPRMNGLELLTIVKDKYPKTIKIILSGYTQLQQIIVTINKIDIYKFITKPWDIEVEFKAVINSAINLYNTRVENENLKKSIFKKNELYQKILKKNNDSLMLINNNLTFVIQLNQLLKPYYQLLGLKISEKSISYERYSEEIEFISNLTEQVLKIMPSKYVEFNTQVLKSKIDTFVGKKIELKSNFEIMDLTNNQTFVGEFNIIVFTLNSIIKDYYDPNVIKFYSLVISVKIIEEVGQELVFLLKTDCSAIGGDKLRVKSLSMFLECLIKSVGGYLSFENKNEDKIFLMKVPVNMKGSEGD